MRRLRMFLIGLFLIGAGLWLNNTSLLVSVPAGQAPKLLAHRGVHQTYVGSDRSNDSCHATPIAEPTHGFLENTIPSMKAAFEAGADVVELDVHLTPDGVFAVFHDWRVDCLTDGSGVTETLPFETLQGLDLGYGYSPDGESYPLRGTGVGMMPSLREVLSQDLGGEILVNFKSRRVDEGEVFAEMMADPTLRARVYGVYGGQVPTETALHALPDMRGYTRASIKDCLLAYLALGWSGIVPKACQNSIVVVPMNIAPFVWGWPHRFEKRMADAGSDVILLGPYDGSGFSSGVDTPELAAKVPERFGGYVWTDRVEMIGPLLRP